MGKQTFDRAKKILAVLLLIFFVVSVTAVSATAKMGKHQMAINNNTTVTKTITIVKNTLSSNSTNGGSHLLHIEGATKSNNTKVK